MENDAFPPDPLAHPDLWQYRMRCRNCTVTTDYATDNSHISWNSFYKITLASDATVNTCEHCGAFAVMDLVAITRQPEGS